MYIKKLLCIVLAFGIIILYSCGGNGEASPDEKNLLDSAKIVSLNGTVSEILVGLGLENQIVGVDVASTYPASLLAKPKVGHSKQITAEAVLGLAPSIIVGTSEDVSPELGAQLAQSGVKVLLFEHQSTVEGAKNLVKALSDSLHKTKEGDSLLNALNTDLEKVKNYPQDSVKPKVLFIYARGTGTMMVGGTGTQVDEMIRLAGGENAAKDIQDYKPLTAESLVEYNPDVLLLFNSGLQSLKGTEGLLEVPGVRQTNAGKNKKIVEMDGQLLSGFSPRLGKAIEELHQKIHQ